MTKNSDDAIVQTLNSIRNLLENIYQLEKQPNAKTKFVESKTTLDTQIKQLQSLLSQYKEQQFTYEFYEELAQAIEKATFIRLSQPLQKLSQETAMAASLNKLTGLAQAAIYQHPSLKTKAKTAPVDLSKSANDMEAMYLQAQTATQHSTEATAAAERSSAKAINLLQKIQAEQKKSGGLVSRELLDESLEITMDMHLKQAAAVIEADLAAVALQELEDLLRKRQKQ